MAAGFNTKVMHFMGTVGGNIIHVAIATLGGGGGRGGGGWSRGEVRKGFFMLVSYFQHWVLVVETVRKWTLRQFKLCEALLSERRINLTKSLYIKARCPRNGCIYLQIAHGTSPRLPPLHVSFINLVNL